MKRARVLVVDDRGGRLAATRAALLPLAAEIVTATSGRAALDRVRSADFALVLLEVRMRGLDGLEVAHSMRTRAEIRPVPVIFVDDGEVGADAELAAYEVGAVDYLARPLNDRVLRAKVQSFVDLDRARRRSDSRGPGSVSRRTPLVPVAMPPEGTGVDGVRIQREDRWEDLTVTAWLRLAPLDRLLLVKDDRVRFYDGERSVLTDEALRDLHRRTGAPSRGPVRGRRPAGPSGT